MFPFGCAADHALPPDFSFLQHGRCYVFVLFVWFEAEYFDDATDRILKQEPCFYDPGVVENNQGIVRQMAGNVAVNILADASGLIDQEPGRIPLWQGMGGYPMVRKLVRVLAYGYVFWVHGKQLTVVNPQLFHCNSHQIQAAVNLLPDEIYGTQARLGFQPK